MYTKSFALLAFALCSYTPLARAQSATDPATFAAAAASSNMFEIESSQLALDKATGDDARQFAQQMIDDHTLAGENMKAAAEADGVMVPAAMAEKEQMQLEKLQAAGEGEAFDEAYLSAQVVAHDEAVALFQAFSEGGQESALRRFAAETLPTLEHHQTAVRAFAGEQ